LKSNLNFSLTNATEQNPLAAAIRSSREELNLLRNADVHHRTRKTPLSFRATGPV
jgi:hypothetical protein